jgi:hypothetical protein
MRKVPPQQVTWILKKLHCSNESSTFNWYCWQNIWMHHKGHCAIISKLFKSATWNITQSSKRLNSNFTVQIWNFCVSAVVCYRWYLFSSFCYSKHLIPLPLSQEGSTRSQFILKSLCSLCAIMIITGSSSKLCFIHFITVKYKSVSLKNRKVCFLKQSQSKCKCINLK